MKPSTLILALVVLLVGLAVFFPSNSLTGHVVSKTCTPDTCLQLCDTPLHGASAADPSCGKGTVCCFTHWQTGVCSYEQRCAQLESYSLYSTVDTYKASITEQPSPISDYHALIFVPAVLIILGIIYISLRRHA